ncbi:MAG: glycerophosphodiester phosphodiesterase family protein [Oscillospiraceae bacterium]|nr:glycerophosphodiester phosphodiesterase family protein [Oscillospiraceae bacterium]
MNGKKLKTGLFLTGAAFTAVGAAAFLIAPEKPSEDKRAPFTGRNYAHRGLHNTDRTVPENSLPAFAAAAAKGYGVELDVHITKDGELAVIHDSDLKRVCGVEGVVEDMTWDEISRLRLCETEYGIPRLSEVLEVMGNQCPVIIELKRGGRNRELCEKTYALMKKNGGRYCVESFDPRIVRWFRHHAPEVLRGQLSSDPAEMVKDTSRLNAFMVGNLLTNFLARPNFIAYGLGRKPLIVKLGEKMGAMKVAWVAKDSTYEKTNDAVIFEHYMPSVKF